MSRALLFCVFMFGQIMANLEKNSRRDANTWKTPDNKGVKEYPN